MKKTYVFIKEPKASMMLAYVKGMRAEGLNEKLVETLLKEGYIEEVKADVAEKPAK